ncbi:hypothetical protein BK126_05360 [Paenibacillus sp. FSL H7-0326]|uniref:GTPase-activating protein n=1 Tax=Paenibacillus sp. FSL H7-0326 TaxID=1921144 RepID=UPI00096F3CA2|nr:GTPase-activating protein [Paenibacillus sp. FSL H7-0326]OMC71507.1 hypothetical protein BK126_05360 [Paenibacillus sp. FSL H7-0326]
MSQTPAEIAKEITIAAIEHGVFNRKRSTSISVEELNETNVDEINKFFKKIAKQANDAMIGKFD